MPTYDYRCKACGHAFELFQSMSEPVKKKCPECGRSSLERLIGTGAAVVFKGSGFYQTDYRSESYKKDAAKAEGKPTDKADAKTSESKKDAPAAPAEKKATPEAKPDKPAKAKGKQKS